METPEQLWQFVSYKKTKMCFIDQNIENCQGYRCLGKHNAIGKYFSSQRFLSPNLFRRATLRCPPLANLGVPRARR